MKNGSISLAKGLTSHRQAYLSWRARRPTPNRARISKAWSVTGKL